MLFRDASGQNLTHPGNSDEKAMVWFAQIRKQMGPSREPSSSIHIAKFYRQYHLNQKQWEDALAFLKRKDLSSLAPGKYPIDGDSVYATITQGPTKDFPKSRWEAHRKFVDLQYVIEGEEKIGMGSLHGAVVVDPYDAKTDVGHYKLKGKFYLATPDTFFLFFPGEAHRPGIATGPDHTDKKLVIKIRYID
ncbi:MAG: YhcH/YjgK/YiaL family protein [Bacteroidota bacterium]|nr:YhcH/YjgK/YiaL family protein [Bacteroidota bacterium]